MASENKSKVSILTNGIIKENPVLRLVLGTCYLYFYSAREKGGTAAQTL